MSVTQFRPLITAYEAFPALEEMFLGAEEEIWASFRIFDLDTVLRSEEGRRIGRDWFDLLVHLLNRGLRITIILTDFDPIFAPRLHRQTWRSIRQFAAVRECARGGELSAQAAMHAGRVGWLARRVFWPMALSAVRRTARDLNQRDQMERQRALVEMPGLRPRLTMSDGGEVRPNGIGLPHLIPATHHQKLAVADRRQLFIGGLDLNERRYDDPNHERPAAETWHDVSCIIEGPVVADAQHHLEHFRDTGPPPLPEGSHFLRTLSTLRDDGPAMGVSPRVVATEILEAHKRLFAMAQRLIYAETQFLRDHELTDSLAEAGRRNPDLRVILVLPAAPEDVAFEHARGMDVRYGEQLQAECIQKLRDAFGGRLFIGAPVRPCPEPPEDQEDDEDDEAADRDALWNAPIIYVHSKVTIADDRAAILSSANLNSRSMRWDTEAGVWFDSPEHAAALRARCFEVLLEGEEDSRLFDLETAQPAWAALAKRNRKSPPKRRHGFITPYDVRAPHRFGRVIIPRPPAEMV